MAHTKRKRRTKHRGTAAGTIEARGRTSRKPADQKKRGNKPRSGGGAPRGPRPNRPPSWKSAFAKAGFMAALLFLLTQVGLLGGQLSAAQALMYCLIAFVLYVPLSHMTDRAVYNWRLRRESKPK